MKQEDYPGLYQAADSASISSQKKYVASIGFYLILLVVGAGVSLLMMDSVVMAIIAAVILLGTLFTSLLLAFKRFDKLWYNGRAVAESVKTITWRYIMKAQPYDNSDEVLTRHFLLQSLRDILDQNKELGLIFDPSAATKNAISTRMSEIRNLSLDDRKSIYLTCRVDDQRAWYSKKAGQNKKDALIWFIVLCVAQALALICVLVKIAKPAWHYLPISVFIVMAGSALTWMQTKRYQELATAYSLAAHEICLLRQNIDSISTESSFSAFVNDSETAFSREHTQWQARREHV